MNEKFADNSVSRLVPAWLNLRSVIWVCFGVFLVAFGFSVLRWPVFAGDTDTWYHLSGGRYFFEEGRISSTSYFSFIEPVREWVNYYWLFQVIVYKTFSALGYEGLVLLRALLLMATIMTVVKFLLRDEHRTDRLIYYSLLAAAFIPMLAYRYQLVRPHMFSFFFMAAFLYILEYRPRWTFLLPVLGLAWCNIHGATYPVLVIICLAYLLDLFVERWRRKSPLEGATLYRALALVLAAWTVMLTPAGYRLVMVPFQAAQDTHMFIAEMRPVALDTLLDFQWSNFAFQGRTAANLLLLLAVLSVLRRVRFHTFQAGCILMLVAGLCLLPKGSRFYWEAVLLALPALKRYGLVEGNPVPAAAWAWFWRAALVGAFAMYPLAQVWNSPIRNKEFPLSRVNLPTGVAGFLHRVNTGGRVLNHPGTGGYMNFVLYPRYRIYADLEMSVFTTEDIYQGLSAMTDATSFTQLMERYEPDYVTVSLSEKVFPEMARLLEAPYEIVFFDDEEVLYAHRDRQRQVVDRYRLKAINPFALEGTDVAKLTPEQKKVLLTELQRVDALYPDIRIVNQVIAMIHSNEKNYERAGLYSRHLIRIAPEQRIGYQLTGDNLLGREAWKDALEVYGIALDREGGEPKKLYRKIWYAQRKLGRHAEAYESAKKALSLFDLTLTARDLYDYGLTALSAGDAHEARLAFRFSSMRLPKDDPELGAKLKEAQGWLEDGEGAASNRSQANIPSTRAKIPGSTR